MAASSWIDATSVLCLTTWQTVTLSTYMCSIALYHGYLAAGVAAVCMTVLLLTPLPSLVRSLMSAVDKPITVEPTRRGATRSASRTRETLREFAAVRPETDSEFELSTDDERAMFSSTVESSPTEQPTFSSSVESTPVVEQAMFSSTVEPTPAVEQAVFSSSVESTPAVESHSGDGLSEHRSMRCEANEISSNKAIFRDIVNKARAEAHALTQAATLDCASMLEETRAQLHKDMLSTRERVCPVDQTTSASSELPGVAQIHAELDADLIYLENAISACVTENLTGIFAHVCDAAKLTVTIPSRGLINSYRPVVQSPSIRSPNVILAAGPSSSGCGFTTRRSRAQCLR